MYRCDKHFYSETGSPDIPVYKSKLTETGEIVSEIVGYDSLFDSIQSYADSCNLSLILARCSRGDMSGLSAVQGQYGDCTQFPKTYAQVLQSVIDGQALFDSLDQSVKDQYGNDFNRWFVDIGSDDWFKKMSPVSTVPVEEVKEEVKGE